MTRGIWALWERSLRLDARHLGGHFLRLCVIVAVYSALVIMIRDAGFVGAPGRQFLSMMAYMNVLVFTLTGVRSLSAVLTEEKEDGTLPLMMLTGISPLAILLGKSTSRLVLVLLLIVVQIPVALFAVTLGGATLGQIAAAVAAITAYVICLANVGLLSSVVCRRSGDASGLTTIWALLYSIVLPVAAVFANQVQAFGSEWCPNAFEPALIAGLRFASQQSVWWRLSEVFESRFAGTPMCWQVGTNLLFGLGCFLTGWWLFPIANRDPGAESTPRRLVQATTSTGRRSWRTAGRPGSNALRWLAFHFDAGGWPVIILKFAAYAGIFLFIAWMQTDGFRDRVRPLDLFAGWAGTLSVLLVIEALLHGGRIFQNEYKAGTWSTLLTLPRSVAYLGYSKVWGAALSMAPGVGLCALLWGLTISRSQFHDVRRFLAEQGFWTVLLAMVWLVHIITWLSAYRHQSQAMARLVAIVAIGLCVVWILSVLPWRRWGVNEDEALLVFQVVIIATSAAMHWSIGRQLSRDDVT
ncbi:MAG: hypothetical protein SFV23_13155 [Planctomycetaceae bacterium]|nr:hypothetical protein [Planctomycetaceae bacterium]